MAAVQINKWLDFLDRVGWTALQAAAGATVVALTSDDLSWQDGLKMVAIATLVAACKVAIAQRSGSDDLGAAVPGQVIQK
jgi:hypothetical protein